MSRSDYPEAMRTALDRLAVPPLSDGFADRVVAATRAPTPPRRAAPRRDRRGLWRRVRQATLVTAAIGMTSAAAVASGLLGAAGIRVPVLTEMLAPAPVVVAKAAAPKPRAKPRAEAVATAKAPPVPALAAPVVDDPTDSIEAARAQRRAAIIARQAARAAERAAFLARHPGLRDAIAAGPEARRAYLRDNPAALAEVRTRIADRREAMIAQRRAAAGQFAARIAELTPEERAARVEAWRARQAALRELRRQRRAEEMAARDEPSEGFLPEPR